MTEKGPEQLSHGIGSNFDDAALSLSSAPALVWTPNLPSAPAASFFRSQNVLPLTSVGQHLHAGGSGSFGSAVRPVAPVRFTQAIESTERFLVLGKWRGVVTAVRSGSFLAVVTDVLGERHDEEIEMLKSEVAQHDEELLHEGAQFYWVAGYKVTRAGTRYRTSVIRFRRLPAWTPAEVRRADAWADELSGHFPE